MTNKILDGITNLNLSKAIIKKTNMANKADHTEIITDITSFKKQRNLVVSLKSYAKVDYLNSIFNSNNQGYSSGGNWGDSLYLNLLPPHSVEKVAFCFFVFFLGGGVFPQFLNPHDLERTYFQPFSIIILICALCILFPWNLNLRYIIYHLDAFSDVVSTHFLQAGYEDPCLITWGAFSLSKDCATLFNKS